MSVVCEYEKYRVFTSSVSSNTWINGSQTSFVNHLVRPLKNVTEVKIVSASFDTSDSNVCYLKCDELTSHFNIVGVGSNLTADPTTQSVINGSLCSFSVNQTGRSVFTECDFDTTTKYYNPIRSVDRLTITLLDEVGNKTPVNSNTFVTFQFTCNRDNFC